MKEDNHDFLNDSHQMTSFPMNSKPSRPDLAQMAYKRHMDECKSIINFLGAFADYQDIKKEIVSHLDNLICQN